jgi:tellurite resistance protein
MPVYRFPVPASFFGMILGLVGLGAGWRLAARVWNMSPYIGEAIMVLAVALWLVLAALYGGRWLLDREAVLAEWRHPVQGGFVALVPVSMLLVVVAVEPWWRPAALALFCVGAVAQLAFVVHRMGALWLGDRDPAQNTPVMYLGLVAGNLVAAIAAGALGFRDLGVLFFGAGALTWIALESIVIHRLFTQSAMQEVSRPTLGIQIAPAAIACTAYLGISGSRPDLFAQSLWGYAILQALIVLRMLPWVRAQSFTPAYWAFTFGVAALPLCGLRFMERGLTGAVEWLTPILFIAANFVIGAIAAGTIRLLIDGRLLAADAR